MLNDPFITTIAHAVPKIQCYDQGGKLKKNIISEQNDTIFSNSKDVCFQKTHLERNKKRNKSTQQTKKNSGSSRNDNVSYVMNVYGNGDAMIINSSTNHSDEVNPNTNGPMIIDQSKNANNNENIYYELGGFQFKLELEQGHDNNKQKSKAVAMSGNGSSKNPYVSIRHIAVGENHCVVMIDSNQSSAIHTQLNNFPFQLYGFGNNRCGQLSFDINKSGSGFIYPGREMESAYANMKDHFAKTESQTTNYTTITLRDIACLEDYTLFLTNCGTLFSCGSDQMENRVSRNYHKLMPLAGTSKLKVEKISCGSKHILMIASPIIEPTPTKNHSDTTASSDIVYGKRKVYGFGSSTNYALAQQGFNKTVTEIPVLSSSSADEVVDVKAGGTFSLFFTKKGFIYSCGDNSYQQQGKEPRYVTIMDVMKLTIKEFDYNQFAIRNICCGDRFSVIVTHHGKVFTTIKTPKPTINVNQTKGFYEMEYFTKNNIHVENAFASKNAIIFQTKHGALFYSTVTDFNGGLYASSIRKPQLGKPKPINLPKFNASMKKVFSSTHTDNYLVLTLMSIELDMFFELLVHSFVNANFSDLTCVSYH
ncbi:hypothetical protein C9374_013864 [Naegleria lovaniensis]|uniref:Uncharacterized protein n=1 Tax=Naegleria lovaniensis TaxID=51637 RepID=A0AA88KPN1_NAELO|nr:uncharacterized protein C9374_013864 [Naegleria lovaniensis]KAG2389304.1 hypothetical protein C9374_013864 [Naegleria lovaniensis]